MIKCLKEKDEKYTEKVRGTFDKNTEAEIKQLISVCQIANDALKLIFFIKNCLL